MAKKALLIATVQSHIAQFHRPLIKILKEEGYEIHVAARDNLSEKNGLYIANIDKKFNVPFERSPFNKRNLKAYLELKKVINSEHYDIISCNTPVGGILTRLAARKSRKQGSTVIYTAHGFHFYKGASKKNWLLYYPMEKSMAFFTDKLITITKEDYNLTQKKFPCKSFRIHGVGIDTHKYDSVTAESIAQVKQEWGLDDKFVILCTGELNDNKNQTTLIHAMKQVVEKVPNVKLLLAGNGPKEQVLRDEISNCGLDDYISMIGYHTDLEVYAHAADMIVTVSFREGLPLNVVEAMYLKKPVVASYNRGHRELVKNGVTGYLVYPRDENTLAGRIVEVATDPEKVKSFGEAGRKRAIPYTDKKVINELRDIYIEK